MEDNYLILINDPALPLFIVALVAFVLLGNVVDGNVREAGGLRDELAVHGLADARGAADEDIGAFALGHGCDCHRGGVGG